MASRPYRFHLPVISTLTYTSSNVSSTGPGTSFVSSGIGPSGTTGLTSITSVTGATGPAGMIFSGSNTIPINSAGNTTVTNLGSTSHSVVVSGVSTASGIGIFYSANAVATQETFASTHELQAQSYADLNEALNELHSLDSDDDWKIQTPVYSASVQVAAALMEHDIPKPGVFTHGPKSVVRGGPVFRDRMAAWLRWFLGLITPPVSPAPCR
jgi:hypothetical protein